ncbi:MAG TPA: hypothetical protein VLC09_14155 [Polyangiaceae bacterium]|nr:hypothetical protein [Polyangiaceae bacterium]
MRLVWSGLSTVLFGCNAILGIAPGERDNSETSTGGAVGLGGAATGGEPGTGTGGQVDDGGLGGCADAEDVSSFATNDYLESGSWKGHLSTFSVHASPDCSLQDASCFSCGRVCVSGTLAPESGAMVVLNFNLNQEKDGPAQPWSSGSTTGLLVSLRSAVTATHRLEIDVDDTHYCALLPNNVTDRKIPWSQFTQSCWSQSAPGPAPASPFDASQARLLVFSTSSVVNVEYDSCLLDLEPYTD